MSMKDYKLTAFKKAVLRRPFRPEKDKVTGGSKKLRKEQLRNPHISLE
jgi:hypothetical protein